MRDCGGEWARPDANSRRAFPGTMLRAHFARGDQLVRAAVPASLARASFQPDREERDVGRRDSTDSTGLAESQGRHATEFLSCLVPKSTDGRIIQRRGNRPVVVHPCPAHLLLLATNIALVAQI